MNPLSLEPAELIVLILGAKMMTDAEKQKFIAVIERDALTPALREELADMFDREAAALGKEAKRKQEQLTGYTALLQKASKEYATKKGILLWKTTSEAEQVAASVEQEAERLARNLEPRIRQDVAAHDASKADEIRRSLDDKSQQ